MLQTRDSHHFVLFFLKKSLSQVWKASAFTKPASKMVHPYRPEEGFLSSRLLPGGNSRAHCAQSVNKSKSTGLLRDRGKPEIQFHVKSRHFQMVITNQTKLSGRPHLICGLSVFNPCYLWWESWMSRSKNIDHLSTPLSSKAFTLKLSTQGLVFGSGLVFSLFFKSFN